LARGGGARPPTPARAIHFREQKIQPAAATPTKTALKSKSQPRHPLKRRQNQSRSRDTRSNAVKMKVAPATRILTPLKSPPPPRTPF